MENERRMSPWELAIRMVPEFHLVCEKCGHRITGNVSGDKEFPRRLSMVCLGCNTLQPHTASPTRTGSHRVN